MNHCHRERERVPLRSRSAPTASPQWRGDAVGMRSVDATPTVAPLYGGRSADGATERRCGQAFLVRVAPPRPRSVTPLSVRTRCTKPYDRPVDSARARMLAPFSYFLFSSLASFSRVL